VAGSGSAARRRRGHRDAGFGSASRRHHGVALCGQRGNGCPGVGEHPGSGGKLLGRDGRCRLRARPRHLDAGLAGPRSGGDAQPGPSARPGLERAGGVLRGERGQRSGPGGGDGRRGAALDGPRPRPLRRRRRLGGRRGGGPSAGRPALADARCVARRRREPRSAGRALRGGDFGDPHGYARPGSGLRGLEWRPVGWRESDDAGDGRPQERDGPLRGYEYGIDRTPLRGRHRVGSAGRLLSGGNDRRRHRHAGCRLPLPRLDGRSRREREPDAARGRRGQDGRSGLLAAHPGDRRRLQRQRDAAISSPAGAATSRARAIRLSS
jgi:hypothetical protein